MLKRYPPDKIFYLPVRLDGCDIHSVDLFPDEDNVWKEGVNQILRAIRITPAIRPARSKPPIRKKFSSDQEFENFRDSYLVGPFTGKGGKQYYRLKNPD